MTENFPRNTGEQGAYGYKQLPSIGPGGGGEFRNIVYAGVGVALGVVVGTLMAGYFQHAATPPPKHETTQARTAVPTRSNAPETKPAPAEAEPNHQAETAKAEPVAAQTATAQTVGRQQEVVNPALVHPVYAAEISVGKPVAGKASPAQRHLAGQVAHGRRRHRVRERLRSRRWRHSHRRAAPVGKAATAVKPEQQAMPRDAFVFWTEGEVTEANYDPLSGVIETYEGETFKVIGGANSSGSAELNDFPLRGSLPLQPAWGMQAGVAERICAAGKRIESIELAGQSHLILPALEFGRGLAAQHGKFRRGDGWLHEL